MKLTRDERKQVFAGTLRVLRRAGSKPDFAPDDNLIVSQTRGGKQIVDRESGATVDIKPQPRLWITIKGWHLKAGSSARLGLLTPPSEAARVFPPFARRRVPPPGP